MNKINISKYKKKYCISITTIPPRFNTNEKTLKSISSQRLTPDKIFLNIPKFYKRFKNTNNNLDFLKKKFNNIKIIYCNDYGPGTKLLGSIGEIKNYDFVILIDDDHKYDSKMLEIFHDAFVKNPNKSYSFCVYNVEDCKIGQGADGFLINSKYLRNIKNFYNSHIKGNDNLVFNDDLWISIFINKILKKDIVNLFPLLNQSFFFKKKSIYKKHSRISSLLERYSRNKKKAKYLKYIENQKEYLNIKKKTQNFKKILWRGGRVV